MVINGPCPRCTPHGDVNKENKEANRIEPRKTKRRATKKKFTGSYTEVNLINVMNTGCHGDLSLITVLVIVIPQKFTFCFVK